jgi:predicted GNAT superfamily acetyltransferase
MNRISLHILENPEQAELVEDLQRIIWSGSDRDIVPGHLLLAAIHNGGLLIGAFEVDDSQDNIGQIQEANGDLNFSAELPPTPMVGFVFGFPGLYYTPDGPRIKHHSHMLGVLPGHRDQGIGFLLKRAQWQMVRHQGLDRITWTYDPLLSRNAHLNIARLGAVSNTYLPDYYGEMRDEMNMGLPSDRFQVDWWVNSRRVFQRLSKRPRRRLDLAHFLAAETQIINPTNLGDDKLPRPTSESEISMALEAGQSNEQSMLLLEIPADFLGLKSADAVLARDWRQHTRALFKHLFEGGYLVTDFIHLPGTYPRSFYVLSHGDSTFLGISKSNQQ